jgi:hypothetical protein
LTDIRVKWIVLCCTNNCITCLPTMPVQQHETDLRDATTTTLQSSAQISQQLHPLQ